MGELSGLPNIGPKVEEQLKAVGIDTAEELRRIGAEDAWLRIQAMDPSYGSKRVHSSAAGAGGRYSGGKENSASPGTPCSAESLLRDSQKMSTGRRKASFRPVFLGDKRIPSRAQ